MNYCSKCILPDTRPGLTISNDGICNACKNHSVKPDIDWMKREQLFKEVIAGVRARTDGYDCIIPVSGGKDSTWQVVKCLEYGLKPLAVTWKTPARTEIGRKNLENLVGLGVDHIDYQISPKVEKRFMLEAFKKTGTTALPMHMALFSIPMNIAVKFRIPLVIWGENSAYEYGGTEDESKGFRLDTNWLKKYGVTHGTTARDWVSGELTEKDLTAYFFPDENVLEEGNIRAVFLGYYFKWDVEQSLRVALENGFTVRKEGPKTGYYNYADIDDDFISIHHYLKWYKFGFTRLSDNLALEIRNGRMTRKEALEILKSYGEQSPDEDIDKFCNFVGIKRNSFFSIAEKFRSHTVWKFDDGKWRIPGFIINDWNWT